MRPSPYSGDRPTTNAAEVERLIDSVRHNTLGEDDRQLLERLLRLLLSLVSLIEQKNASLARLKRLLFGSKSEKRPPPPPAQPPSTASEGAFSPSASADQTPPAPAAPSVRRVHGRRPASAYPGAVRVVFGHPTRHAGDRCPDCARGTLFDTHQPITALRFTAQPLVAATCYQQQVLRCSACQTRFPAPLPPGVPTEKYDASADVAIVLAKYGAGLPFYRLSQLQEAYGVPLSPAVAWERSERVANAVLPIWLCLRRQAAGAEVLAVDDTGVQILSCAQENKQKAEGERTGLHTTGVVAWHRSTPQPTVVLYTSSRRKCQE